MRFIKNIFAVLMCVFLLFGDVLMAEDVVQEQWTPPVIQQVRMPAGIRNGMFLPAHDELVIFKPGAWMDSNKESSATALLAAPVADQLSQRVTLIGKVKLFDALKVMAVSSGKTLVLGPGVEDGEVAADARDLSVSTAIKDLLWPRGYGFSVNGGELVILARDTRMFRLNLPPVVQAFSTSTTNESSSSAGDENSSSADSHVRVGAKILVENSMAGMSYWQDVEANVRSLMSSRGTLSINKAAGVVIVTDTPRDLDRIAGFIDQVNESSSRQIVIDMKVVEVELSREHKFGIDWNALFSTGDLKGLSLVTNFAAENIGTGPAATFSGRSDKAGSGDAESGVKAVMKALESFGRVEVVSQPRIMMLNNSVASLQVGETRSYVQSSEIETTQGGSTVASASLDQVHGGVTLQIVASIAGEDVFLNVTPVVSTIDGIRTITLGGGSKLEAPETSMKTMSTLVRVRSGRTVAIGGLITRSRSKERQGVPFLGRVPFVGRIFSYELRRNSRTELVIFMTPRRS